MINQRYLQIAGGVIKRLLSIVRAVETGNEPPHLIMIPGHNDMRHVARIVTTIPASIDPKRHIAELLTRLRGFAGLTVVSG